MPSRAPSTAPTPLRDTQVHPQLRVREWAQPAARAPLPAITRTHPWVELSWVERGEALYRIEGQGDVRVGPGEAMVVPAGTPHATQLTGPFEGTALCIGCSMVDAIADAMGPATRVRRLRAGVIATSPSLVPLARVLRAEAAGSCPGNLLAADAVSEAVVVELLRRAPVRVAPEAARDARVNMALDRIHTSYAEPLTVDDLARVAKMSRFHFSRLFRQHVGQAPYRYLLRVRVRRAAELLRRGHHDVTESAFAVGFRDLGRFGRMFRREMGCCPSELGRQGRVTGRPHGARTPAAD